MKAMRKPSGKLFVPSLAVLFCLHLAAARLAAQEAYKIDEIKNPRCDLSEVPPIDPGAKFATALYKDPEARGAIVMYGLEADARVYAEEIRERLNNYSGTSRDRLVTIYGGPAEDMRMELWVIPRGAAEPKSNFVEETKGAREFAEYGYLDGDACPSEREPALKIFAEELKRRPEWQGQIILRLHRNPRGMSEWSDGWDPDGRVSRRQALRRTAKDKLSLVKLGVPPSRVEAVVRDDDKWTHAELWLVAPGAEPPAAKAVVSNK